jgi:RNA polymerase sigma-70 factor (ECF subfamily)
MEYLRRNKPTLDIDDLTLTSLESPERQLSERQIIIQVRHAVEILPLTQRQVITLVDLEGCSYAEVTEILDIPMGTVMSRLSRARKMLKEQLMHIRKKHTSHNHLRRVK